MSINLKDELHRLALAWFIQAPLALQSHDLVSGAGTQVAGGSSVPVTPECSRESRHLLEGSYT